MSIKIIHPFKENKTQYDIIQKKSGCIVSTFPRDQVSFKGLFPARNSTIAGLSLGVLVKGIKDCGVLIIAQKAKEFDKLVFLIWRPKLIKTNDKSKSKFVKRRNRHFLLLQNGPLHFDQIVVKMGKDAKNRHSLRFNGSKRGNK